MSTSIESILEANAYNVLGGTKRSYADALVATQARSIIDANNNMILLPAQLLALSKVIDSAGHLVSPAGAPTVASGAGIGTGGSPAASILTGSKDGVGILRIVTGSSAGTTAATLATVTFAAAFAVAPIVRLSPHNAAAAALSGAACVYPASESTTGFLVKTGSTALATSTTYDFVFEALG